ncbi:lipid droplet-associated hydrolase-like isoform X2 [Ricinus communis]|uniref:lipid droplet-associated hydrolase-like isoform X2 n=1 Tax=Ricinus communis TaxID=3988 RepID=UPI00201A2524|nr:lipid droplet-associated hydrolase-like isoform X2 [Ricinus communis]
MTIMKPVSFRLCNVSSYTTELLEIEADFPKLHVLFIPGNPGLVALYKDFLESLYERLGGVASITGNLSLSLVNHFSNLTKLFYILCSSTAIGHISHTKKDWEHGRLFSLQEQIDHKVDFITHELQNVEAPIILVGHSIGSYISIETLRRCGEKVIYCIALYPFLTLNPKSIWQPIIRTISESSVLSAAVSFSVALSRMLPKWALRLIVFKFIGKSCSATAAEAACSHLPQLSKPPDWTFMMENKDKITFLFGDDDHWGPLQLFEEISKQVPEIALSIEREGHTHCFSCTEAGSEWVAGHVACLIKNQIPSSQQ